VSATALALIGAGRIGRLHARAIEASERLRLTVVAEPQPEAAAAVAGPGVRRAADVAELLRRADFDAAIVAAPSSLHVELVRALAAAGVPVLCEKPCGIRSDDARAAGAAAEAGGVLLQVGYWRRFVDELRALRRQLLAGELGRPSLLLCAQWDELPPPSSFRERDVSGGILVDMGVHEFDTLRWLTGQELSAMVGLASMEAGRPSDADPDTVGLVARLSGGASAVVTLTRRHPPGDLCRVEVLGSEAARAVAYLEPPRSEEQLVEALRAQAEGFAAALDGAPREGASAHDAAIALEAAERAAETLEGGEEAQRSPWPVGRGSS
jgi:myo-inositol 2-dehydrogenase / D-chiro-inositol 1-dehydrogenase